MGISSDAYTGERQELADLLTKAAELADACNLWFSGRPGMDQFLEIKEHLLRCIKQESVA